MHSDVYGVCRHRKATPPLTSARFWAVESITLAMDQLGEEAEAPAFGGSAPRGGLLAHFGSQNCLDAVMPLSVAYAPFVFARSGVRRWQLP